jgi:hypothetical protein
MDAGSVMTCRLIDSELNERISGFKQRQFNSSKENSAVAESMAGEGGPNRDRASDPLSGIKDINPPFRLSVTPYISNYYENYPYNIAGMQNSTFLINGGMDVKVGLNESFTLDLTLIPDFGQVQSDNRVLNLTPFETKYDEKRPFFMEGTELFNTAGIFYSRRIGGLPTDYYKVSSELTSDEKLIENPAATKMINAFKLSGRTNSGFGVGLFNSSTLNTYARVKNEAGTERLILTQPWTNYNILVASCPFNKTSQISIINTNVYYGNGSNLANVSGFDLKIADKKNNWAVISTGVVSQKFDITNKNPDVGEKLNISAGKIGGKFQFSIYNNLVTNKFNSNDMGYLTYNNYIESGARFVYNIFKPFGPFNSLQNVVNFSLNRLFEPVRSRRRGQWRTSPLSVRACAASSASVKQETGIERPPTTTG